MTDLSPQARAVLEAVTWKRYDVPPEGLPAFAEEMAPLIAAALRAAVEQVVPEEQKTDKDEALIDSLHLSTRTENALKRCKVLTLGDLRCFTFSDLLLIKGFGVACADEVVTSLASIGVSLPDSAQARSLSWSDVIVRKATRADLLALAAELDGTSHTSKSD